MERLKEYYLKPNKLIRDHAHEYVFFTDFELTIIDTIEFQRLKDVRQLTCQQVYPGARHTRFEHSLGVMELTRRAINALNCNGFISRKSFDKFDDNLIFNVSLAALLHDIGHCPFSHLGEREFDKNAVWIRLYNDIERVLSESSLFKKLQPLDILNEMQKDKPNYKKIREIQKKIPGAIHEQLSCCVILENIYYKLAEVNEFELFVDFELICRCILGIEYDTSSEIYIKDQKIYESNQRKNVLIRLINSSAFDMDKLDYIIRDSCMTGIGTPRIDTNRLFRNMFLNDNYELVFSSRAVPALQNMVDSRDELYMYVYNHHAVIFSDFMYTYIFRRLAHNDLYVNSILKTICQSISMNNKQEIPIDCLEYDQITNLGSVSKDYLFSPESIIIDNRSDGDLTSLINVIRISLKNNGCNNNDFSDLLLSFKGLIKMAFDDLGISNDEFDRIITNIDNNNFRANSDGVSISINDFLGKIKHTYELIDRYMKRDYLKPWWKTYSEFNMFIELNFPSDNIRRKLCDWICNDSDSEPAGDEFRSQLAKHVRYITHNSFVEDNLCEPLAQGDFFVIERSAKFFDPKTLKNIEIAQKTNEVTGNTTNAKYLVGDYYIKELPQIIPQKDYYSFYAKNSFYVFSKRLDQNKYFSVDKQREHYRMIEQIFIFVATEFVKAGEIVFQSKFGSSIPFEKKQKNEIKSQRTLCSSFVQKAMSVNTCRKSLEQQRDDTN